MCLHPFLLSISRSRTSPAILKIHHDNVGMTGARIQPEPDLKDLADFSTCAVVGSSSSLKDAGMGAAIDSHTAVIRFNDAPTKSHQVRTPRNAARIRLCRCPFIPFLLHRLKPSRHSERKTSF